MDINSEIRNASRLLQGLENGNLQGADAFELAEETDPVVLHLIFAYLRAKYPASNESSKGVMERLLELSSTYPALVSKAKKGEKDPITEWFMETYSLRDFYQNSDEMIQLIIEKIEG